MPDMNGRELEHSDVARADELATAASLVMGQANEAIPAVLIRGVQINPSTHEGAKSLNRPKEQDLFR